MKRIRGSKTAVHARDEPKEVMAEGIVKTGKPFTDEEIGYIIRRRKELAIEGMKDATIARKVGGELGRTIPSIVKKIKILIKKGKLEINENKQKNRVFTLEDIDFIIARRNELALKGMNDSQIGRILAAETGRSAGTLHGKIQDLVSNGHIDGNPNKRQNGKPFTKDEIELIIIRRAKLVSEGMNDLQIGGMLADETGRTTGTIYWKICELIKDNTLEANPNKRRNFSEEEIDLIRKRWDEHSLSITDNEIAKEIANDKGWSIKSVRNVILRLRKNLQICQNLNNRERTVFGNMEIAFIKEQWNELCPQMSDAQIAKDIVRQTGWKYLSVLDILCRLHDNGGIGQNPNKRMTRPKGFFTKMTDVEVVGFAKTFLDEKRICEIGELKEADLGIYTVLWRRKLIDAVFPESAKKSESELLAQLKDAVELYLGKGEKE